MKKIRIKFPKEYPYGDYYGLVNGGIYTIDPCYDSDIAYLTKEKTNYGKGVYVQKEWCTVLCSIDLELPEDLFN